MTFLKLRCDTAYFTGAIRTNLSLQDLVNKFARHKLPVRRDGNALVVTYARDTWVFDTWEPDGLGQIGWLRFTTEGDLNGFSHKLALINVRHWFEHSRPADVDVTDARCVTRYVYRWDGPASATAADSKPAIDTIDEIVV